MPGIPKTLALLEANGVALTQFIPLACRAREFSRPHPLLEDAKSSEVFHKLDGDKTWLMGLRKLDETFVILRARQFDRFARAWLADQAAGTIVDIGCGLDTRFYRLDNACLRWIGIDLPGVIALRRKVLPDEERATTIPQSVFDFSWTDRVKEGGSQKTLFLAEGVLPYFEETQIHPLISELVRQFPGSEIVFDAFTALAVKLENRTHTSTKEAAALKWSLNKPASLDSLGAHLLDEWGYFDSYEARLGTANLYKYIPGFANMVKILRYRLGN